MSHPSIPPNCRHFDKYNDAMGYRFYFDPVIRNEFVWLSNPGQHRKNISTAAFDAWVIEAQRRVDAGECSKYRAVCETVVDAECSDNCAEWREWGHVRDDEQVSMQAPPQFIEIDVKPNRIYERGGLALIEYGDETGAHIPGDFQLLWEYGSPDEMSLACWNEGSDAQRRYAALVAWIKCERIDHRVYLPRFEGGGALTSGEVRQIAKAVEEFEERQK